MGEINDIQSRLLKSIFLPSNDDGFDSSGLDVYRRNLRVTASKALGISFPTVLALIGEELFQHATEKLLQESPPTHGDWGLWGDGFAEVLSQLDQLLDYPFIADCAILDFKHHELERAANSQVDMTSLQLLKEKNPDQIKLILNPNIKIIESKYPIADIWHGIRAAEKEKLQLLHSAISSAPNSNGQMVLLYRPQFQVMVRVLSETERGWMQALETYSLESALTLMESKDFSFEQWLLDAVQQHLLDSVAPLSNYQFLIYLKGLKP